MKKFSVASSGTHIFAQNSPVEGRETCPNRDSANLSESVGRNLQELKRLKRRKRLTPCLELLEKLGLSGDVAIFVLGQVEVEA
jgi:hypothetical protein